jgi:hypothetical protein
MEIRLRVDCVIILEMGAVANQVSDQVASAFLPDRKALFTKLAPNSETSRQVPNL